MKVAILGSNPLALEAAVRFQQHGAALTFFNFPENFLALAKEGSWEETTTDLGWSLLTKSQAPFTWENWQKYYYLPLVEILRTEHSIKPNEVTSITKRYLAPSEEIPGKSRFYDLFRLIFEVSPEAFIEAQKESDPEVYKRLKDEVVQSLQHTVEMYEDFDLVLDLRLATESMSLAPSGRALGERRNDSSIEKGLECLKKASEITSEREIILAGSGELALRTLLELETWLKDPRSMLFIATTEEEPFSKILASVKPAVQKKFEDLKVWIEGEFEKEITLFHQKLRDWQGMEDYIRAKYPRPAEPIPRLNYFSGHNVTAVDQLVDRKKLFVTLERPEFREGKKHPDNNLLELKTLGVDMILSANGLKKKNVTELQGNEVGYFDLAPSSTLIEGGWQRDLATLRGIEDEIFKLFSPAGHS